MEETKKCACGGDIQDGVCLSCGQKVEESSTEEEMGSNIDASEETPATEEEAAA